jgi:hypothetical protein
MLVTVATYFRVEPEVPFLYNGSMDNNGFCLIHVVSFPVAYPVILLNVHLRKETKSSIGEAVTCIDKTEEISKNENKKNIDDFNIALFIS